MEELVHTEPTDKGTELGNNREPTFDCFSTVDVRGELTAERRCSVNAVALILIEEELATFPIWVAVSYKNRNETGFKWHHLGTGHFLWVGGGAGGFWGGHPKIFELKGGPSRKLKAEVVFYR